MNKQWVVAFATEKFYLIQEDADFYRQELSKGKKFVLLKNGMVLSDKCLYIVHKDQFEETDRLEEGEWQCDSGKWHSKNSDCHCGQETVLEGNTYKWVDKLEE